MWMWIMVNYVFMLLSSLKGRMSTLFFFTHHVSCALVFAPSGNTRKYKLELDSWIFLLSKPPPSLGLAVPEFNHAAIIQEYSGLRSGKKVVKRSGKLAPKRLQIACNQNGYKSLVTSTGPGRMKKKHSVVWARSLDAVMRSLPPAEKHRQVCYTLAV